MGRVENVAQAVSWAVRRARKERSGSGSANSRSREACAHVGAPASVVLGGAQTQVAGTPMPDHGPGDDNDAMPGQADRPRQLEAVIEDREGWRGTAQLLPDGTVDEGSGGPDRQDVGAVVMLTLIDLAGHDIVGPARRDSGAKPDFEQALGAVPVDLLGADQRSGTGLGDRRQQSLQTGRCGRGVVVKQPEPVAAVPAVDRTPRAGLPGGRRLDVLGCARVLRAADVLR